MRTKKLPLFLAGLLGTAITSHGATVMTTIAASSDGQARDTNSDGTGDSANAGSVLTGVSTNTREGNINALWAFSLTDAIAPNVVCNAEFSVNVNLVPSNATFNVDLHVIRIASSDAFLASDYENSDSLILADFWTPTSGSSSDGLGTFTADMTSYLQAPGWTSSDFLIVGLKSDPFTVTGDQIKWLVFDKFSEGVSTGATLTVAVPEPSSTTASNLLFE